MEAIIAYFSNLNIDIKQVGIIALVLLLGTLLMNIFGRFVFGKRSALNNAASSAIGILFIYTISVLLRSFGDGFQSIITPLPFVSISGSDMHLFTFQNAH